MNLVTKIARAELRGLFYSPIAWFLSILLFVHLASIGMGLLYGNYVFQESVSQLNPDFRFSSSLTHAAFNGVYGKSGLFIALLKYLYYYFPLLTMGLISAEINRGTIRLLQSSPVKVSTIVTGKFLAMVLYIVLVMCLVAIFALIAIFTIENVEVPLILSGMLGFFLLLCVFAAIGMFMSSLTTYIVVSGIATFVMLMVLANVGNVFQGYDVIRDLTFSLGLNRGGDARISYFVKGLITSRDVIYFVSMTTMFVLFTYFRLRGLMDPKSWYIKVGRYGLVFSVVLVVLYISSRYQWTQYWDVSRDKVNTIHPDTERLLSAFEDEEPLEVTLYGNFFSKKYGLTIPETRNNGYLTQFWEKYIRFKPDMKFEYVYYHDMAYMDSIQHRNFGGKSTEELFEIGRKSHVGVPVSRLIPPDSMRTIYDFKDELYESVMVLRYKDRSVILRLYNPLAPWPDEIHVATALKVLQSEKGLSKIRLTSGNLERSPYKGGEREYYRHFFHFESRTSLINLGFETDTLNLDFEDIGGDVDILVIADPKTELSPVAQEKIRTYLSAGGNAYFLGEPNKQMVLNPLLADLGVELAPGMLLEVTHHETPEKVISHPHFYPVKDLAPSAYFNYEKERAEAAQTLDLDEYKDMDDHAVRYRTPSVTEVLRNDSNPEYTSKVILSTNEEREAFRRQGHVVLDSVPPQYNPEKGDVRKTSFATLVSLTRDLPNKQQRIFVSGDADFLSTLRLSRPEFLHIPMFSWLVDNQYPVYVPVKRPDDTRLSDVLTTDQVGVMKNIFIWVLPALFILGAVMFLIRRRRQ